MKRYFLCGVFILSFSYAFSLSGQSGYKISEVPDLSRAAELRFCMLGEGYSIEERETGLKAETPGKKSRAVSVLLSAALPGTGEFYAGSWLKGAIFLGAEIALWMGYSHFSSEGQDWEDIFHDYADTHWDEDQWRTWMAQHPTFGDTTHSLPSTKTQQYYEMIGKYNQFKGGWDDYTEGGPALTPNRDYYEDIRHKSNQNFIRASYCAMAVLANRLISAFDASWTTKRFNRRIEGNIGMSMRKVREDIVPFLTMQVRWRKSQ